MVDQPFAFTPGQQAFLDTAMTTGFNAWCAPQLSATRQGYAAISLRPRAEMLTPWGTLNGAVMNSLVELPSFIALLGALAEGELPVTSDIFIQHVRPMPGDAEYLLEGTLLRRGRTMAWTEVTASVDGKPVTFARITKSIVAR